MSGGWWSEQIGIELEQGDVLRDVTFLAIRSPLAYIKPKSLKGGLPGWEETTKPALHPKEQRRCVVAYEVPANGIIISHGCDIDKPKNEGKSTTNQRILVAPVLRIDTLPEDQHADVLLQRRRALMPLPEVPQLGTAYVDLRLISPVPRPIVDACTRVASMTPDAVIRLQAQVAAFLFRTA